MDLFDDLHNTYNELICSLGVKNVIKKIQDFCDSPCNKNAIFITIGGGTAEVEFNAKRNILNIDPFPMSYVPPSLRSEFKVYIEPISPNVKEFIKNKEELICKTGKHSECDLNKFSIICSSSTPNNEYEIEAIKLLNPVSILYIYDQHPEKKSKACRYGSTNTLEYINLGYKKVDVFQIERQRLGVVNSTINWYVRNDLNEERETKIRVIKPQTFLYSEEWIDHFFKNNPQCKAEIEQMKKDINKN